MKPGEGLTEFGLDSKKVVGLIWNGKNYYSAKQILGNGTEEYPLTVKNGLLDLTGIRFAEDVAAELGDLIYTCSSIHDFDYDPQRGGLFRERNVHSFILRKGEYELAKG